MPPKVRKRRKKDSLPQEKKPKSSFHRGKQKTVEQTDVRTCDPNESDSDNKSQLLTDVIFSGELTFEVDTLKGVRDVQDDPEEDDEDSGKVVVVMRNKTSLEKEKARQARLKQLTEYNKREASLARKERYNRRYGVGSQMPAGDEDKEPGRKVQWRRDSQLVTVHCIDSAGEDNGTGKDANIGNGNNTSIEDGDSTGVESETGQDAQHGVVDEHELPSSEDVTSNTHSGPVTGDNPRSETLKKTRLGKSKRGNVTKSRSKKDDALLL